MYQDERKLDFKPLGIAIKKAREAKGWTQEYLAQLVDLTPRSIMYIENRGQHPRLNKFYLITTLLDISVDQFFFPCNEDGDNNRRKQVDVLLNGRKGAYRDGSYGSRLEKGKRNCGIINAVFVSQAN